MVLVMTEADEAEDRKIGAEDREKLWNILILQNAEKPNWRSGNQGQLPWVFFVPQLEQGGGVVGGEGRGIWYWPVFVYLTV